MKVHESQTVNGNGSAPEDDEPEGRDYSKLFEAPSYSDFIKVASNSKAQTYQKRVQSVMKAGMIGSINARQYPDAATFIKHGPGFATAAGNLAAVDARAAALIEMLTAPDSPYITFAMVAIPFIAQLSRNHQGDIQQAGMNFKERRAQRKAEKKAGIKKDQKPPITVRLGKRRITIPVRIRVRLPNVKKMFSAFIAPTQHPQEIAAEVFNDAAVVKALHKMGLYAQAPEEPGDED